MLPRAVRGKVWPGSGLTRVRSETALRNAHGGDLVLSEPTQAESRHSAGHWTLVLSPPLAWGIRAAGGVYAVSVQAFDAVPLLPDGVDGDAVLRHLTTSVSGPEEGTSSSCGAALWLLGPV